MSHLVVLRTQVRDATALAAACRRLGLSQPVQGTARLFSSQATGQIVQLPGWTYPVVFDTATGKAHYDNFTGAWGDQKELGKLLQRYAAEKACQEAPNGPQRGRAGPARWVDQVDHSDRRRIRWGRGRMSTIQIIIDPQGQVRLETKGFTGASCREASKSLEQALGLIQSDRPTSEQYQQTVSQEAERHKISG